MAVERQGLGRFGRDLHFILPTRASARHKTGFTTYSLLASGMQAGKLGVAGVFFPMHLPYASAR